MRFEPTAVEGAFLVVAEPRVDDRGHFARVWCVDEFADAGIATSWLQENVGFSHRRHTLRGMHFQHSPDDEAKLVRCTRGDVFDVAVDLRPESPTYRRWTSATLSPENGAMLYIPEGCGHGYLTLADASEISYLTSAAYAPASASGARWDDPAFEIDWPAAPAVISEQDAGWPDWAIHAPGTPS